ncbi:TetR/AcrR family transcriptional regulator [Nocardia africana]|uniref:Transcriptional regulator BetI n=1 Tax=Nocardia africana TaxID=134964 RepID=A0A378WRU0_9NOCA|nr:TetR/AcrR family transcriptional regulator [Nocardia africana]MCC3314415.1 TetR/AcrR family transcriptional regulator [Nocardia africana]SUA43315.1 transcriptional regulator BetI [Nocardia africana]
MSDVTDRVSARSGRRAGESGTREAILDAARTRFAEVGFDKASIRSIAGAAGVDPALVHHYFGTKQQLFSAALNLPIDPELIRAPIRAAELDRLGETVVRTVVGAWDSSVGVHAVAAFRGILAGGDAALARSFLLEVALKDVREKVDSPPGSGTTRVVLAVSQMIGLLVARKILQVEPVASMPLDELAAAVGPTIQRYLTGDLPAAGG